MSALARTATVTPPQRQVCGIYARKSNADGLNIEFNTLEAQRVSCLQYIEAQKCNGWEASPEIYEDGGYSGGNTDRPALTRLIEHVIAGKINVVVVYKLERFSRSVEDFVTLHTILIKHNVAFVSVTQHFDTSTTMGRFVLNLFINIAELDLGNMTDRIRDKIALSKQRGMWLGGYPLLGYDVVNKKLVINETEAEIVRFIFSEFVKCKSYKRVVEILRKKEIKTKTHIGPKTGKSFGGNYFTTGTLECFINNPTYNGKIRHKKLVYEGQHEGIISDELWQATRHVLRTPSKERAGITKRKIPAILAGLLKCGGCNSAMGLRAGKNRHGKIYRYYVCVAHQKGRCLHCSIRQLSAPEIESVVLGHLQKMVQTPELVVETWKSINEESTSATISEEQIRTSLSSINGFWDTLFPGEQERLLKTVIDEVIVQQDYIELRMKIDAVMVIAQHSDGADTGASMIASVKVPFTLKHNGVRTLISLPKDVENARPKHKPDKALFKALCRAEHWQTLLDTGKFSSAKALCRKYRLNRSSVCSTLQMTLLAPKIKQAILDGTQPRTLNRERFKKSFPLVWTDQMKWFGFDLETLCLANKNPLQKAITSSYSSDNFLAPFILDIPNMDAQIVE